MKPKENGTTRRSSSTQRAPVVKTILGNHIKLIPYYLAPFKRESPCFKQK